MKKTILILLSLLLAQTHMAFAHGKKEEKISVKIETPPEILSRYYPPESMKMEFIEVMHGLSGPFKGTWIDAKEGQWEKALKNAEALETNYKKAYDMTGKAWQEKYFKLKAASDFRKAVAGKDMNQMGRTAKELGGTCGKCHQEQYVNVWLKFHWGDFEKIELEDPVTEKKMGFEDYKHLLVESFYTLMNDGKQGETANAAKGGKEFVQRYRGLKASCMKCHEDEQVKYFYVGGKVEKAMEDLSAQLRKEPLNMGEIFKNIGVIGKNGCKKCHLTHRWAAILKKAQN